MRPTFEKNYFLLMYAMLCKYNKNRLPCELVEIIKFKCLKIRKECRQNHAKETFGKGKSKLSAKRRAQRFERCVKCGKPSHFGACPKNQTYSNYEFLRLIKDGPVQSRDDNTLNKRGYAYLEMKSELRRLKERGTRIGIKL